MSLRAFMKKTVPTYLQSVLGSGKIPMQRHLQVLRIPMLSDI